MRFTATVLLTVILSVTALGQTTVKLFDAVAIDSGAQATYETASAFATAQVYLSCPSGPITSAKLTGPNGGKFIVDNFITVNGTDVCPGNCFSELLDNPMSFLGESMDVPYLGVDPIDISAFVSTNGLYTFSAMDYGYTLGTTEVYLTTTCSSVNQVCHRNNGSSGQKTLNVGAAAVAAHLAHGDTAGPCS
jgi:hypothetical protein